MFRSIITFIALASLLMLPVSCGPTAYVFDVELRQPSASGLDLGGKSMSVVFMDNGSAEDSLFMGTLAGSFADGLDEEYFGGDSLIQVFSLGMKPDVSYSEKDTMVNLLVETGSDVVFLFDTPDFGTATVTESVASGEGRSSVSGVFPYTVTLYVYDAMNKEDRVLEFHGNGTGKSSAYIDGNESRDEKLRMLKENLAGEARTAGQNSVSAFRTGWKKENVFFYIYDNDQWYRAYYAAAEYNWQKAMDIWMSMLDTKNMEKKACLEFNLATACYIQGRYDLAEEWIELSAKDMQLPLTGSMQRTISSKL